MHTTCNVILKNNIVDSYPDFQTVLRLLSLPLIYAIPPEVPPMIVSSATTSFK